MFVREEDLLRMAMDIREHNAEGNGARLNFAWLDHDYVSHRRAAHEFLADYMHESVGLNWRNGCIVVRNVTVYFFDFTTDLMRAQAIDFHRYYGPAAYTMAAWMRRKRGA